MQAYRTPRHVTLPLIPIAEEILFWVQSPISARLATTTQAQIMHPGSFCAADFCQVKLDASWVGLLHTSECDNLSYLYSNNNNFLLSVS